MSPVKSSFRISIHSIFGSSAKPLNAHVHPLLFCQEQLFLNFIGRSLDRHGKAQHFSIRCRRNAAVDCICLIALQTLSDRRHTSGSTDAHLSLTMYLELNLLSLVPQSSDALSNQPQQSESYQMVRRLL